MFKFQIYDSFFKPLVFAATPDAGKPRLALTSSTASTDYAALDRFRSRVGSIVRPTGESLISNRNLQQQPCTFPFFLNHS